MPDINAGNFVSHRRGGSLQITDVEATEIYDVLGVDEDSMEWTPGMYEALLDTEGGQPSTERRGDKQRSSITVRFKQTKNMLNASSLYGILGEQVKATDDGMLRTFDIIHRQTDHSGDATGETATFTNCVVVPGTLRYRSGADYNTIECQFTSRDHVPALGTF